MPDPEPILLDGRYQLGGLLGHGGMGEVRLAHDQRLRRDVAVKLLRPDLARDPAVRARFEHEARAAARLSHPNVVAVFDSGEHDGAPFLVMERLPGTTLADELRDGPLTAERATTVGAALLGALAAAHDLGIVHRDVKPTNILIAADGTPKLADFGIAKSAESIDQTTTGMVVGSASYLAPERITGQDATARSDLYSVGVVLYEALTATRPFPGDTPAAVIHAMQTVDPPPVAARRPDLDPALSAAIARAMAKDPRRRFASAAAMAAALVGAGSAATTAAGGGSAPTLVAAAVPPAPLGAATTVGADATLVAPAAGLAAAGRRRRQAGFAALALSGVLLLAAVIALGHGGVSGARPPAPRSTTVPVAVTATAGRAPTTVADTTTSASSSSTSTSTTTTTSSSSTIVVAVPKKGGDKHGHDHGGGGGGGG